MTIFALAVILTGCVGLFLAAFAGQLLGWWER